jgi:CrcB protein
MMLVAVGVLVAGACGAVARFVVDGAITSRVRGRLRVGTFVINVSGAFLLGVITGFTSVRVAPWLDDFATVLGTGLLGGYTTFSTDEWQTLLLRRQGAGVHGLVIGSGVVVSLALGALGIWLGEQT